MTCIFRWVRMSYSVLHNCAFFFLAIYCNLVEKYFLNQRTEFGSPGHLLTSHGTLVCCNTVVGNRCLCRAY